MPVDGSATLQPKQHPDAQHGHLEGSAGHDEVSLQQRSGWSVVERLRRGRDSAAIVAHLYGYPLLALVRRDLKTRYAQTIVGFGWTVLQPLILLLLYTFVFSVILQVKFRAGGNTGEFALYLTSAMFPFLALSEGVQRASTSLSENRSLLDKVLFPAEVLPAVSVVSATISEIIGLTLLIGLTVLMDVRLSGWIVLLPLLVLLRVVFTMGLAWLVSVLNVFFTDIGQSLGILFTAWMFLTPIFYPVELVPDGLTWALQINPLYHLVSAYRAVLLEAQSPLPMLPYVLMWCAAVSVLGLVFFRKTVERAKDFL
jgi:ABC-type polysaccharide/polyol phosphate export permease